jgi:hypothetical protein
MAMPIPGAGCVREADASAAADGGVGTPASPRPGTAPAAFPRPDGGTSAFSMPQAGISVSPRLVAPRQPATPRQPESLSAVLAEGREPSAAAVLDALAPYAPALLLSAATPAATALTYRELALAAHQIERFCGKRVPSLPQQKREYVASWIRATDSHRA